MVEPKRTKVGTEQRCLLSGCAESRRNAALNSFPVFLVSLLVLAGGLGLGKKQLVPRLPEPGQSLQPVQLHALVSPLPHDRGADRGRMCVHPIVLQRMAAAPAEMFC